MSSAASTIQVSGLDKKKLHALRAQAKAAGISAEDYAKQLIEDGISLERQARRTTLDELYSPSQERFRASGMKEDALDKLVEAARTTHHRRTSTKKA